MTTHSAVSRADLDILDLLTSTSSPSKSQVRNTTTSNSASPFHQASHSRSNSNASQSSSNFNLSFKQNGKKPLATLAALRRPPIDPIILAASLSSGPQVTRHHFHHAFGADTKPGTSHNHVSEQMPASERKRKLELRKKLDSGVPQSQNNQSSSAPAIPSTSTSSVLATATNNHQRARAGSYANCDLDDDQSLGLEVRRGNTDLGPLNCNSAPLSGSPSSSHQIPTRSETILKESAVDSIPEVTDEERAYYSSRQAPRSVRLKMEREQKELEERLRQQSQIKKDIVSSKCAHDEEIARAQTFRAVEDGSKTSSESLPPPNTSIPFPNGPSPISWPTESSAPAAPMTSTAPLVPLIRPPPLSIRCYARTRVPTPHGEVFLHLYKNNHDNKEHLALVVDEAQDTEEWGENLLGELPPLRSRTLDEVWSPEETELERIVRGAYIGRLGPTFQKASSVVQSRKGHRTAGTLQEGKKRAWNGEELSEDDIDPSTHHVSSSINVEVETAPLVRIHSECYTGETIGSQRCDCGEQLDEAIRLICESGLPHHHHHHQSHKWNSRARLDSSHSSQRKPARGVIVYLRQEGRGIGLLSKLMAYNLQDMGHDTVAANILLGHLPDARKYDVASAILRDLGVEDCRLMTNNPEKMEALEAEGVKVKERVGMVPRAWRCGNEGFRSKKKKSKKAQKSDADPFKQAKKSSASKSRVKQLIQDQDLESSIISQDPRDDYFKSQSSSPDIDSSDHHQVAFRHQHGSGEERNSRDHSEEEEDGSDEGDESDSSSASHDSYVAHILRRSGATMTGAGVTRGNDLEKYLRTKVEKMGHLLELPPEERERELQRVQKKVPKEAAEVGNGEKSKGGGASLEDKSSSKDSRVSADTIAALASRLPASMKRLSSSNSIATQADLSHEEGSQADEEIVLV